MDVVGHCKSPPFQAVIDRAEPLVALLCLFLAAVAAVLQVVLFARRNNLSSGRMKPLRADNWSGSKISLYDHIDKNSRILILPHIYIAVNVVAVTLFVISLLIESYLGPSLVDIDGTFYIIIMAIQGYTIIQMIAVSFAFGQFAVYTSPKVASRVSLVVSSVIFTIAIIAGSIMQGYGRGDGVIYPSLWVLAATYLLVAVISVLRCCTPGILQGPTNCCRRSLAWVPYLVIGFLSFPFFIYLVARVPTNYGYTELSYVSCPFVPLGAIWWLVSGPMAIAVMHANLEAFANVNDVVDQSLTERLVDVANNHGDKVMKIKEKDITILKRIAVGGYGEVYLGRWRSTMVAVKRSLVEVQGGIMVMPESDIVNDMTNELAVLSSVRHPNVLLFLGIVDRGIYPDLVTEFVSGGSLFDQLHLHKRVFTWPERVLVCLGAARGMEYLHDNGVIHRDLKSSNLLMDAQLNVKISDFGLSRFTETLSTQTTRHGTLQWTAPEVLNGDKPDRAADVYSFGVILWEVATNKVPFSDLAPDGGPVIMKIHRLVTQEGFRQPFPKDTPEPFAQLVNSCCCLDPKMRPSFGEIAEALQTMDDNDQSQS